MDNTETINPVKVTPADVYQVTIIQFRGDDGKLYWEKGHDKFEPMDDWPEIIKLGEFLFEHEESETNDTAAEVNGIKGEMEQGFYRWLG